MRFLVVYKESVYRASLHSHRRSFAAVERILRGFGIPFDRLIRGRAFGEDRYSLVISLGGDGTFLDAARYLKKVPIMGVNSAPGHSVGRFCPVNRSNLRVALNDFFGKRLTAKRIHRLNISLNGKTWKHPVLNDVLVCHAAPAAMSRYVLSIGKVREAQRSSGLWVSTAAGLLERFSLLRAEGSRFFLLDWSTSPGSFSKAMERGIASKAECCRNGCASR